jgi:excinuclease ABC subunit C
MHTEKSWSGSMKFDLEKFPPDPGVYLMKNRAGTVIYVGKAINLKRRIKQYFSFQDQRPTIPLLVAEIDTIETIVVSNEKEAFLVENTLIKRHGPKYNVLLKDDKTFISLMVNVKHAWPTVRLIRYKGKPKKDALYFGPYTSAYAARQTFDLLIRLFPLRQCSDEELKRRTRPCLLYEIKRCIAPCVNLCTREEYHSFVDGAIKFLKGQDKEIVKTFRDEMEMAAEKLEFEKAAALHKTIQQIEHVTKHSQSVVRGERECDALGLYRIGGEGILMRLIFREGKLIGSDHTSFSNSAQDDADVFSSFILQQYKHIDDLPREILLPLTLPNAAVLEEILHETLHTKLSLLTPKKGEKHHLIELAEKNAHATFNQEKDQQEAREKTLIDLQEALGLNRYPERIECFDTSNISGSELVASLVAFTNGVRDKKRTRLFKIRGIDKGDDYAALHQSISRHLMRAKEKQDLPDLIIIDGGKGQLNIALDVFKELDIASVDVISLTKEEGRHDRGITSERVFVPHHKDPISLSPTSPLLFFLQNIRDETHRSAIHFQRKRTTKRTLSSELDTIPGIGPVKRKRLLQHFGSLARIRAASHEALSAIPGITEKDIAALKKGIK